MILEQPAAPSETARPHRPGFADNVANRINAAALQSKGMVSE
jgi:hypothetical protein